MQIDFTNNHVLVIGDIMVDHYVYGHIHRTSPEAEVPIVLQSKSYYRAGGAANVALNVIGLGAKASLIGIIGKDPEAVQIKSILSNHDLSTHYLIEDTSRPTTKKTRLIADKKHIARIDHEVCLSISDEISQALLNNIISCINRNHIDIVILQDYNKGLFTSDNILSIIKLLNEKAIPFVVDPKKDNFYQFKGAQLFKPNLTELRHANPSEIRSVDDIFVACKKLLRSIEANIVMVTLGNQGLIVVDEQNQLKIDGKNILNPDVCGAGDAVIAMSALAFAIKLEILTLAELSNLAGALACKKVGVNPINIEDIG